MSAAERTVAEDVQHALTEEPFQGTRFSTVERLGSGGMGEVYLVEHRELGKRFVAKILHGRFGADPRLVDRMRVEAQALGCLNHPNIVTVTGCDTTEEGRPFIVMEQLRGCTLASELVARRSLPLEEALVYASQTLSALAAAHGAGIVHRDIKPENLFLHEPTAGPRTVKVLDFGVARVLPGISADSPSPLVNPTETGMIVGTPRFLSPEGARGRRVDERADIYAVGLLLYEMLTGRGPFDHLGNDALVLAAHATDEPEAPSRLAEQPIPAELDRLILKALNKAPEQRFSSAHEFAQALAAVRLDGPASQNTELVPVIEPVRKPTRSMEPVAQPRPHGRLVGFVLMTILAAVVSGVFARLIQGGMP
ncbi:MAG TPA: serine/threonine-protein kinase [Polyangiaceae bacterium]